MNPEVLFFIAGCAVASTAMALVADKRRRKAEGDSGNGRSSQTGSSRFLDWERDLLWSCLDLLPVGVVVEDGQGRTIVRNRLAAEVSTGVRGEAIVEAEVQKALREVDAGQTNRRSVDLYGPPRRSFEIMGFSIEQLGFPGCRMAVIVDTTERTRIEQVRRDFVANVSHEMKTPVGALMLLAETLSGETDEETRAQLAERMVVETRRLSDLVEDLLSLARAEGGRREDLPVQVKGFVQEALQRVEALAERSKISIRLESVPPDLYVKGDRVQLVSAMSNLVDNAVKFSPRCGSVEVEVCVAGDSVRISVHDQGPGIPKTELERIFERFYRVDPARNRRTGGTGLGLAIARHIASNHGGEIQVESRLGEGSTFTLVLPRLDDPRQAFSGDPHG